MQNPLEITFHQINKNDAAETLIREKFENVKRIASDVTKCHVVIEKLSKHHQSANTSCVRVDLKVPHISDIIVSEKCTEDEPAILHSINKVFKNCKLQLREEVARRRDRHRVPKSTPTLPESEDLEEDELD